MTGFVLLAKPQELQSIIFTMASGINMGTYPQYGHHSVSHDGYLVAWQGL